MVRLPYLYPPASRAQAALPRGAASVPQPHVMESPSGKYNVDGVEMAAAVRINESIVGVEGALRMIYSRQASWPPSPLSIPPGWERKEKKSSFTFIYRSLYCLI